MERRYVSDADMLPGYDALQFSRNFASTDLHVLAPTASNEHLKTYYRIHKVYVGESGSRLLRSIHEELKDEHDPLYLDAAGWAAAEAALVDDSMKTTDRVGLIESAESCWERALGAQEVIDTLIPNDMVEDDAKFRLALSLAFAPLMKALVVGNVTESVRERVFTDVLALAQLSGVQRDIAVRSGDIGASTQLLGFEHECNAHLALLHMNDARYLPLPSSARAGSGTSYPEQTHDIVIVNQHWGKIRKIIPLEIKAKASLSDIKRYDALVLRGKMHLSVIGKYSPEHTRNAFEAYYEGTASHNENKAVYQVVSTVKRLLSLYQKGNRQYDYDSPTTYHDRDVLQRIHPEYSLNRARKY